MLNLDHGKSKGPRVKPKKPSPPAPQSTADLPKSFDPKEDEHPFWNWWKFIWGIVGAPLAVAGFLLNFWPHITIDVGANLDPAEPFQTLFRISNTGKIWVSDLRFNCSFGARRGGLNIETIAAWNSPLKLLSAGDVATRSCLMTTNRVQGDVFLDFEVRYRLPIIGWERVRKVRFTGFHGKPGFILVPDTVDTIP